MSLKKPIIIDAEYWKNGQGDSSTSGRPAELRLVDIDEAPGVLRLSHTSLKNSGTVITSLINAFALDKRKMLYGCTTDGKVYLKNLTSWNLVNHVTTPPYAGGIMIAYDYLFLFNGTDIDVYGPLTGASGAGTITSVGTAVTGSGTDFDNDVKVGDTIIFTAAEGESYASVASIADTTHLTLDVAFPADVTGVSFKYRHWTDDWKTTLTSVDSDDHNHSIFGQDNIIYVCHDRYIATISELTTFTPGGTEGVEYHFENQALDLPEHKIAKCLDELRQYLLVGTIGRGDHDPEGMIFPWDRTSVSFEMPIKSGGDGVHQIISDKNYAYAMDKKGNIFITDGLNIRLFKKISQHLNDFSVVGQRFALYPYAVNMYNGKICFGIGFSDGAHFGPITCGIYSLEQDRLTIPHIISTGTVDGSPVLIGALAVQTADRLFFSWRDNTTYGVDRTTAGWSTNYEGFLTTELFQVGTHFNRTKFQRITIQMARPLRSGDGVRIQYRDDLLASWTTINTWDTENEQETFFQFDSSRLSAIQFKIALKAYNAGNWSPEFLRATIEPSDG